MWCRLRKLLPVEQHTIILAISTQIQVDKYPALNAYNTRYSRKLFLPIYYLV